MIHLTLSCLGSIIYEDVSDQFDLYTILQNNKSEIYRFIDDYNCSSLDLEYETENEELNFGFTIIAEQDIALAEVNNYIITDNWKF